MAKFTQNMNDALLRSIIEYTTETNPIYVAAGQGYDLDLPSVELADTTEEMNKTVANMMFGKKVYESDIKIMIRRIPWLYNTVYDQYDDQDAHLFTKNFFVINSDRRVYKCLYNNKGKPSTIEPSSPETEVFELADGYSWQYMFRVTAAGLSRWGTDDLIPVYANSAVESSAIKGGINVIDVVSRGSGYITTHQDYITDKVSPRIYRISNFASSSPNFYTDSAMYITTGTGTGSLAVIEGYSINASGKYVSLKTPITADLTSQYLISPQVLIKGNGTGAKAYSTVTNQGIEKINMISAGSLYSIGEVDIVANTSFGGNAVAKMIIPPLGGHGSDPVSELGAESLRISVQFSNNEVLTIPTEVSYRQISLIKNLKTIGEQADYTYNTFDNTTKIFVADSSGIPPVGELMVGTRSTGQGVVVFANTSVVFLSNVLNQFIDNELLVGQNTGVTCFSVDATAPELDKYFTRVLYINNIDTVPRSNTTTETINLTINL